MGLGSGRDQTGRDVPRRPASSHGHGDRDDRVLASLGTAATRQKLGLGRSSCNGEGSGRLMNNATRPRGVMAMAVMALAEGVFGLTGASTLIGAGRNALAVVLIALTAAEWVFAYGAWTLKRWAWNLGYAAQLIAFGSVILAFVTHNYTAIRESPIVLFAALICYYLGRPDVRRAMGRA